VKYVDKPVTIAGNQNNEGVKQEFQLPYDHLILAVGAVNKFLFKFKKLKFSTFGTPGVYENCYFLKEVEGRYSFVIINISDAVKIRRKIMDCFEAW
jgi:NADH dehydrogenase FAD-containing subunit